MLKCLWILTLTFSFSSIGNTAEPAIPKVLEDWQEWVLYGKEEVRCPFLYNKNSYQCVWISQSEYSATAEQLSFTIKATTFLNDRWISLPGAEQNWPIDVRLTNAAASPRLPVRAGPAGPQVKVPAGKHYIEGRIPWQQLPSSIEVPRNTGILSLRLNGQKHLQPEFDKNGHLLLQKNEAKSSQVDQERAQLRIFRLVEDRHPAQVLTRVELDVSGKTRELDAGPFLLPGTLPMFIDSALPARIEKDGRLRVQVKPGRWVIEMRARHEGPMMSLGLPATEAESIWPESELWAFRAMRSLRTVQVTGTEPVDPKQTNMPGHWQQYPGYRISAGEQLGFEEVHRGDPQPEADDLRLSRNLYLDFDGEGFTVRDELTGAVKRNWRLDTQPDYSLGNVTLNGIPQLVTLSSEGKREGVEVRQADVNLIAVGRIENGKTISASGWQHDLKNLQAHLQLPPGWSLFAGTGADK